jgi:hypothetical protein
MDGKKNASDDRDEFLNIEDKIRFGTKNNLHPTNKLTQILKFIYQ